MFKVLVSVLFLINACNVVTGLEYLAGSLTWDAFRDNSTYVIVKTRLVWNMEHGDDLDSLCYGTPRLKAEISVLPITISSVSLRNETTFDCIVRDNQLQVEGHFLRHYGGDTSYQEMVVITGSVSSNKSSLTGDWKLSTLINFEGKNSDGSVASPPHVFMPAVTVLNPSCNQTARIGAVDANRFGYVRCAWPTVTECGDMCNGTLLSSLFTLKENCEISVIADSRLSGLILIGIKVRQYEGQTGNNSKRETFLHFTVSMIRDSPCYAIGLEWDYYGGFEFVTLYHEIRRKYCQTSALEVDYIGLTTRDVDARLSYYGPPNGDFFYNRTESGNNRVHKLWWAPTINDLGTNVVCLQASPQNSNDALSISTCFFLKIYVDIPGLPRDMCGSKPYCRSDSVCLDPNLRTPATTTTAQPVIRSSKQPETSTQTINTPTIPRQRMSFHMPPTTKVIFSTSTVASPPTCEDRNTVIYVKSAEERVKVQISAGTVADLPVGRYYYHTGGCSLSVHILYNEDPAQTSGCPSEIRGVVSQTTGLSALDLKFDGTTHRLELPAGTYNYHIIGKNLKGCSLKVLIKGNNLMRRLDFESKYKVKCVKREFEVLTTSSARSNYNQIRRICEQDCSSSADEGVVLSCENDTLTVRWQTDLTFDGAVYEIPGLLLKTLSERIVEASKYPILNLVIMTSNPPIVYPVQTESGAYTRLVMTSYCTQNMMYDPVTDTCTK